MTFYITFIINRLFYGLYVGWLFLGEDISSSGSDVIIVVA